MFFHLWYFNPAQIAGHLLSHDGSMGLEYLLVFIYHKKSALSVGKYTSRMDPTGLRIQGT